MTAPAEKMIRVRIVVTETYVQQYSESDLRLALMSSGMTEQDLAEKYDGSVIAAAEDDLSGFTAVLEDEMTGDPISGEIVSMHLTAEEV